MSHRLLALFWCVCIGSVAQKQYNITIPIGATANLTCHSVNERVAESATWNYVDSSGAATIFVEWIKGVKLIYSGQWIGRTVLDTNTGNIVISTLVLPDDGRYKCEYHIAPEPPIIDGDTHNISILVLPTLDTVHLSGLDDLDDDWVDRNETYPLKCLVDPIKPEGSVYWKIGDTIRTDTQRTSDLHTNGTFGLEGNLQVGFSGLPSPVKVECLVTEKEQPGSSVLNKPYKEVQVGWKAETRVKPQGLGVAEEGEPYTLECEITGGNPQSISEYAWTRGGQPEPEQTGSMLFIQKLDRDEHTKPFTCAAKNSLGMGGPSGDYEIDVLYPPDIQVTIPASVVKGYTVTLECRATGGNPSTLTGVQWKHNGTGIEGGTVNNPSITLQNIQRTDAGTYICILRNQAGPSESQANNMDVLYAPEGLSTISISTKPRTNMAVGESLDFTCTHSGDSNPKPDRFTFYENDNNKSNSSSANWVEVSYMNVNEGGEVSCKASNEVGHAQESNKITITVEANATIEEFQVDGEDTPVYDDPDIYLDCLGAGNQRTVSWKKQGQAVSLVDWKVEQDGTEGGDYTFKQTEAHRLKYRWKVAEDKCATVNKHNGTYTCQVYANAGDKDTQDTRNWDITVQYPPLPISGSYYIPSGAEADEIVTLTCDVCSYPEERSYKWSFNGEEVGKEREHFINGMTESKFGNYSCEVSNTINGEVRTAVLIYHVRTRGGPSAVQDLNTAEVTSQTVNVTFIPGFNGGLKQNFTVEYKLVTDPNEKYQEVLKGVEDPNPTDPDEASGPRIPVSERVRDLEAEQTYTFRVRSENDFHDENNRYSPWEYVNASTLERPEVRLNTLDYTFLSEDIAEHIKFSWEIVKGQPESLTLKYRLDTVNTLADESEWMVMVEGVNPLDKEYSSETSENLDPKKDYVFILVTMEAKDVNGGASADFPVKGPDSPTNPGGSNVGAIAAGVIGVLVVGIAVGVILTVLFMKRRKTTKKEEHVSVNVDVPLQERSNPQSQSSHGLDQEPQLHHAPHPRKEQSPEPPSQQQEGEYELIEDQVKPQLHPKPNHGGYLYMAGHRSYYNKPTNNGTVSPYEEIGTKTLEGGPPNIYDRISTTNVNVDYENPQ